MFDGCKCVGIFSTAISAELIVAVVIIVSVIIVQIKHVNKFKSVF